MTTHRRRSKEVIHTHTVSAVAIRAEHVSRPKLYASDSHQCDNGWIETKGN